MLYASICSCVALRIDFWLFFFQAEDGIRDLVRSRGLGDVYKRQFKIFPSRANCYPEQSFRISVAGHECRIFFILVNVCLLYTSDAADERSSVDLGGRRIIKKKNIAELTRYS